MDYLQLALPIRGAFLSVNSSLQQMARGLAAIAAGLIVTQKDNNSPLEHYGTLGIVVSLVIVIWAVMVYFLSRIVKAKIAVPRTEAVIPAVE